MGQINSKTKPSETVFCSLCYDLVNKDTLTSIKSCKHKLCKSCYHGYNINYTGNFCPLCNGNH
jgi:hypothetical protein